jgi:hypothetical protein
MTLVEFLEPRLAEDELMASAAIEGAADWHVFYASRDSKDGDGLYVLLAQTQSATVVQAAHIAGHSPARIRRQCEAARVVSVVFLRLDTLGDLSGSAVAESALSSSPPRTATTLTSISPGSERLPRCSDVHCEQKPS